MKDPITREWLRGVAEAGFGDFVKAVVDVEKEIMAIGSELHADAEVALVEREGSKREHTWGINIYPEKSGESMIEFDSMVNIKPLLGNRSRDIENEEIRQEIKKVVGKLIQA